MIVEENNGISYNENPGRLSSLYQDVQFESYAASACPRLLLLLPVSRIMALYFWHAKC